MSRGEGVPPGIDVSRPSVARAYDFFLGGKDNFAADREMGARALEIAPDGREAALANRAFLRRVVRVLAVEAGIDQFLDVGSGLPTQGNVHEVVHAVDPVNRVVYVDNDPIVLVHGRALLADNPACRVVQADVRRPKEILSHREVTGFLDLRRPVGLLLFAILHHLGDDEDPGAVVACRRSRY